MANPHKIIWNWDVSFGNILSILLTVGAVAAAMIGGYIRYEKRFIQTDERISHVEEATFENGEDLDEHVETARIHVTEAEASLLFVPRTLYELHESAQDKRIREGQTDLKADLSEIKGMVRENGRAGIEQYRSLSERIDKIVDP